MEADEIVSVVGHHYRVPMVKIIAPCRTAHVSLVRQIAAYVLRVKGRLTFPAIGKVLHRDHSTAVHSVNQIKDRIAREPQFAREVARIVAKIGVKDAEIAAAEWPGEIIEVAREDAL